MTSAPELEIAPLDRISAIMDSPVRPLDGALIVTLNDVPSLEALERGAESARSTYPITRCRLDGRRWTSVDPAPIESGEDLEAFVDRGAPIREVPSPRQLLIGDRLVTLGHHAVGDLVSILAWVRHQLDVARGIEPAVPRPLTLRTSANAVRKSRHAWAGASNRLWHRGPPSGRRRTRRLDFEPFRIRGGTYNDALLAISLDVFARFNRDHGARTDRIAVWCPVNVRRRPFDGFGNGSSRIRIYRTWDDDVPLGERVANVHEQVRWTMSNGEWFVPTEHPLLSAPDWLLRAYLSRPWVDMATAPFSHGTRIGDEARWADVRDVELVGQLDRRHPFGVFGVTFAGRTRLSLLYDPGQLEAADVDRLAALYEEAIASC